MQEKDYICWHSEQTESSGRLLKALDPEAAAKKAVDIWRHEEAAISHHSSITVLVREPENYIYKIQVASPDGRSINESHVP